MTSHFRHCSKHKKKLPCVDCAWIAEAKKRTEAEAKPAEPVAVPVQQGRGRPKKYSDGGRAKDAQRKRGERFAASGIEATEKIQKEHHDFAGAQGEASGSFGMVSIAQKVDGYQKGVALGDDPSDYEISVPDRKRTAVPVSQDDRDDDVKESDSTHVNVAMRKEARSLRVWIRGPQEYKRPCVEFHAGIAERFKDSREKIYCGRCKKLLVHPGKKVRGIILDAATGATK